MQLLRFPYFPNFLGNPPSDSLYQFYKNSHLYSLMEFNSSAERLFRFDICTNET